MYDIYCCLSGAMSAERRMGVAAHNLANASTTGYRANHVATAGVYGLPDYAALDRSTAHELGAGAPTPSFFDALRASLDKEVVDYRAGASREGDRSDLMIVGDGFFVVRTPQGDRYTRQGDFTLDAKGDLRTVDGHPVIGRGGRPISIGTADYQVQTDGAVVDAEGKERGAVRVVRFADTGVLAKQGDSLFGLRDELRHAPEDVKQDEVHIEQGCLESSNVEVVDELVEMIELHRAYEMYQKLTSTSEEMTASLIRSHMG